MTDKGDISAKEYEILTEISDICYAEEFTRRRKKWEQMEQEGKKQGLQYHTPLINKPLFPNSLEKSKHIR